MSSKPIQSNTFDEPAETDFNLPFSLYLSFAEVADISLKPCGIDGQPLPGAPAFPAVGPCGVLCEGNAFARSCADNHARIIETVIELRRPNIFNCHMRLAAWAIPILHNGRPLPAAIICGGVLLREADSALISHLERAAVKHGVDPAGLVRSLDAVPVLPRERIRAIAEFLFQMSAAFTSIASPTDASAAAIRPAPAGAQPSLVFPPTRKKETKKAKLQRARAAERQSVEADIIRLLRERKPDAALEMLTRLLIGERAAASGGRAAANLDAAETFTRLFRMLAEGKTIPRGISDKQSLLVAETLSQKTPKKSLGAVGRSCREFISVAEEMTGEPRPRQTKSIQRFLERNLAKKLTLGGVGKKFGLKEKALDALMRKHFGMGFTDYVASMRVSEAKRLLSASDLSMGEIARRTGFKDQSYFTKVFKSRTGSTPTEFRKRKGKQT